MTKSLTLAIDLFGGQTALAKAISALVKKPVKPVIQSHIWAWLNRDHKVPAEYCIPIEKATKGKVKAVDLRPDVFGR